MQVAKAPMRIARWAGLVAAMTACSYDRSARPPADGIVDATPSPAFLPATATIRVNGTVTWRFGLVPHNVTFATAAGRPADIPGANASTSVARTFPTAGTFAYECTLHPGMRGTVVVASDDSPPRYPTEVDR